MAVCDPFQRDAWDFVIPGALNMPVTTVVSDIDIEATVDLLSLAQSAGAHLEGLNTRRYGERLDHRLKVSGIGTEKARDVSRHTSEPLGIRNASIDHHILSPVSE